MEESERQVLIGAFRAVVAEVPSKGGGYPATQACECLLSDA